MSGNDLMIRKPSNLNVRQEAARATLREVRLHGHIYVELREVGRRTIFFCTLCLTPCYSDTSLFDHLRGNLHARRYAAAKATLFGPVPWPFNDGVLFFSATHDQEQHSSASSPRKYLIIYPNGSGHEVTSTSNGLGRLDCVTADVNLGFGTILGSNGSTSSSKDMIIFSGTPDRGNCVTEREQGLSQGSTVNGSGLSGNGENLDLNGRGGKCLKLKSYEKCLTIPRVLPGDPACILKVHFAGYGHIASRISRIDETANKIRRIWCAWLGMGDSDSRNILLTMAMCDFGVVNFSYCYDLGRPGGWDDADSSLSCGSQLEIENLGSPRKLRKSLPDSDESQKARVKEAKRLAAERMCDICGQPMLMCKDVATLLNRKTWNIACSSRNTNGAFHVFHTSCLIHWILLCESEIWNPKLPNKKANRTGIITEEDHLEKPSIPLSQMFQYKLKAIESHKAWMKNPEILEHCSTGLSFSSNSEENFEEQILPVKLLHFYRAC
ncbi:unnamed protein product [Spirodela intermedia]|uniref:C2H2-type domain-containing protein n=1 Tax=Spirodela intermedia TaxID=51605 RepID=A0A7I8I9J7_SPIIN|nr:unnamed protein product [Spirodela intermedia]CAA6654319.1 unnamed protein product [Spirodela intermedia]